MQDMGVVGNGGNPGGLRPKTRIEKEAKDILKNEKLQVGLTLMPEKRPPGVVGERIGKLKTNLHGLVMTKVAYVYRYEVKVILHLQSGKDVEFTKRGIGGDAEVTDRRKKCAVIFQLLKDQKPEFFRGGPWAVYYDQQVILYSMSHLYMNEETNSTTLMILDGLPPEYKFRKCSVEIRPVTEGKDKILLGHFPTGNDAVVNLYLEQFLSIVTNQYIIFNSNDHVIFTGAEAQKGRSTENQIYLSDPQKFGFRPYEYPDIANGVRLGIGCSKATRYIEGPGGFNSKTMSLLVEAKKTPFYKPEPIIELVGRLLQARNPADFDSTRMRQNDLQMIDEFIRGLSVDTTHDRPLTQRFKIHRVFEQNARQKTFDYNGQNVTVEQYYMMRYNIQLEYPLANLLDARFDKYYPMELCIVSENQKVREQHQQKVGLDRRAMVEKCSMQPDVLMEHNRRMLESLSLENNQYLRSAGLEFYPSCLQVDARMLPPPTIDYKGTTALINTARGNTWQGLHFLIPADCTAWAAYCMKGGGQRSGPGEVNQQNFTKFIRDQFMREMRNRGMTVSEPSEVKMIDVSLDRLYEVLNAAKINKLKFVLIVHPDAADEVHHAMKLYERMNEVTTQGLKIGTVQRILLKPQPATVQNIVQKTNMKLGGLNYSLCLCDEWTNEVLGKNTLFIGFGVNHPAGGVLGFDDSTETSNANGNGNGSANGNGNGDTYTVNGNGQHGEIAHPINGNGNGNGNANGNGNGSTGGGSEDLRQRKIPSVVGFSANVGKHPFEFIGDFYYQTPQRDEKVNIIYDVVSRCLKRYIENRGSAPDRVFIYRNGSAEGQFPMILKYEIPLIRKVLGGKSKCTVVVSNRLQKIRLVPAKIDPRAKAVEKNIQPGTVVDTGAVHPTFPEFFVVSSRALQGTSRVPKYSLIYDENGLSMDQLENITYRLAYGHQIVCLPTSLPSPVYIAEEYAKRGRNLYRRYMGEYNSQQELHQKLGMSYEEITKLLSFNLSQTLGVRRVNA